MFHVISAQPAGVNVYRGVRVFPVVLGKSVPIHLGSPRGVEVPEAFWDRLSDALLHGSGANYQVECGTGHPLEMLRRLKIEQAELLLSRGVRQTADTLVCALPDGSPLTPNTLTTQFPRFARKLPGMPPTLSFHDLRHSFATFSLQAGIHPKIVQEALGHSSISITMDTYSHVQPTMQEQAAARLDELFR